MRNSKISDRQMAKKLGVSQPTITRRRNRLEKEVIDGYTAIPQWKKLGYEILAITLVKATLKLGSENKVSEAIKKSQNWLKKHPNVIFGAECRGMGMTGVMFSLHKNYTAFDSFMANHRLQLGHLMEDIQTIIVNLTGETIHRSLHLKYLAEAQTQNEENTVAKRNT